METDDRQQTIKPELVCPAGNLSAVKSVIENGADAVYFELSNQSDANHRPVQHVDMIELQQAIDYAQLHQRKLLLALDTFPQGQSWYKWLGVLELAHELGVYAVIAADTGLLRYASRKLPQLRLHLAVQGAVTSRYALNFYIEEFAIQQVVLPRILSLATIKTIIATSPVGVEVIGFGDFHVMLEGRCILSSYVSSAVSNSCGGCVPAAAVSWQEARQTKSSWLNGIVVDKYRPGELIDQPVICSGRYKVMGNTYYAMQEPAELDTLNILPELLAAGVAAIRIEGRQQRAVDTAVITRLMRDAIDRCYADPQNYAARSQRITVQNGIMPEQAPGLDLVGTK